MNICNIKVAWSSYTVLRYSYSLLYTASYIQILTDLNISSEYCIIFWFFTISCNLHFDSTILCRTISSYPVLERHDFNSNKIYSLTELD